ncbi:MAG: alkane 1-monooxygenase [Chitinophagaceae bacterium]
MKPVNYLGLLLLPALVLAGFYLGGWYNFMVPAFCFFIHPALNSMFSSWLPKTSLQVPSQYSRTAYRWVALSFVPVVAGLTIVAIYIVSNYVLTTIEFTGFALSVGVVNGVLGITLAHEFIHRFSLVEQVAGYSLLLLNNYMHYGIEHVWGHHVYACTAKDPHTARLNESLYSYLPRAIRTTYTNAWEIEEKRIKRNSTSLFKGRNRLILFAIFQLILMFVIFAAGGWKTLFFFLSQNMVAVLLLHIINYLQHYGLQRKQDADGMFEKMNAHHSWDSCFQDRSLFIFQLENHADHHLHPNRNYEQLTHLHDAPEHPAGYSFMVLMTLFPPLWFRVMNRRLLSIQTNITA